jgi:hypothetical protein
LRKTFLKESDLDDMFGSRGGGGTRVLEDACFRFLEDKGNTLRETFSKENKLDGMFDTGDSGGKRACEEDLNAR